MAPAPTGGPRTEFDERTMFPLNGWLMLLLGLVLVGGGAIRFVLDALDDETSLSPSQQVITGVVVVAGLVVLRGLFLIQPNQAVVLTFFGNYRGTVRVNGLRWTLPLYSRRTLSLRLHSFDGDVLKVNDRAGNPIEVSAVVVWRVGDTARAVFSVDNYREFVALQSEAAVRDVVASYSYDADGEQSLRAGGLLVAADLRARLTDRLGPSGVVVEEARLNHLAYAPEIAGAMLRRQQAQAVVAARASIVDGAVVIARNAVEELGSDGLVTLDAAQRAQIAANLLVVLCSDTAITPTLPMR